MRLIKLFKCLETECDQLEREVNSWVEATGANVVNVSGNIAPQSPRSHPNAREMPSDVLLVVTYEPATVAEMA